MTAQQDRIARILKNGSVSIECWKSYLRIVRCLLTDPWSTKQVRDGKRIGVIGTPARAATIACALRATSAELIAFAIQDRDEHYVLLYHPRAK